MRRAPATFAVVLVAGLLALALTWDGSTLHQNLGVSVVQAIATLKPGGPALCTSPIGLGEPTEAVTFNPSAPPPDTPALAVTVRDAQTGAELAHGGVPARFDPTQPQTARLSRTVSPTQPIALCIADVGHAPVAIFGAGGRAVPCSLNRGGVGCGFGHAVSTTSNVQTTLGDRPVAGKMSGVLTSPPLGLGTILANTFRHASLFRPGFVGQGLWWALLALLVLGVPALLLFSLRGVFADAQPPRRRSGD